MLYLVFPFVVALWTRDAFAMLDVSVKATLTKTQAARLASAGTDRGLMRNTKKKQADFLVARDEGKNIENADELYGRAVAFTAVFGFGKDPQRGRSYTDRANTDIHYKSWAESVENLGLQGVVLHDTSMFSTEYVAKSSTAHLHFHAVNLTAGGLYSDPARKNLTSADWRFVAMHDYLSEHPGRHDYVLLTDASDVAFRRDPLAYMKAIDATSGYHFLFGQEEWRPWLPLDTSKPATGENSAFGRLTGYWKSCFKEDMPEDVHDGRMTNCGILGGHVSVVKPFLAKMLVHYASIPIGDRFLMCDMLVYLRTVTEDYNDRFISGYPFHSKFKHVDPNENAVIYHKSGIPSESIKHRMAVGDMSVLEELPSNITNSLAHGN
jgi:hypothetical protein